MVLIARQSLGFLLLRSMKDYRKSIKLVVFISLSLYFLIKAIEKWIGRSSLLSVGTSIGVIALITTILYILWNNHLWKIKKFKLSGMLSYLCGFHDYPDLAGQWAGDYCSSYNFDEENKQYTTTDKVEMDIRQNYLSIKIRCRFGESSESKSFFSTLLQDEHGDWGLIYAYRNDPRDPALQSAPSGGIHEGFAYLKVKDNGDKLEGYYTTDEMRKTRGRIVLQKKY